MSKSADELYIETLSRREARLAEEFARLNDELDMTLDVGARIRIERQIDENEKEQEKVATKIAARRRGVGGKRAQQMVLDEHLPKIDFREAMDIVGERLGAAGNAAAFLIQNSRPMGGGLCVARIKSLLLEETHEIKHYPVGFSAGGQRDEWGFLRQLATHVGLSSESSDLATYARDLISKLADSLPAGAVAFIEVSRWDFAHPQDRVLSWLINDFWVPFVRELPNIHQKKRRVRLVLLIVADSPLPLQLQALPISCQGPGEFHNERIIELALRNWTRDEIKEWVEKFIGPDADKVDSLIDVIYNSSQRGVPGLVCNALHEQFSQGA